MRLIDADRMKQNIIDDGGHETAAELRTWVENQITIDAIPVEWLHEKMLYGEPDESKTAWRTLKMWEREQEAR